MPKNKISNPFAPAEQVQKKLKVLVYGEAGTGKTWFSLTFPGKIAVIDCEGGTELYGGRDDVQPFDVLRTKRYDEVMAALDFIEADNGETYQTVVVDPITVVWQILQEAASLKNEARVAAGKLRDAALTYRDWGIIKNRVNRLYTRLANLPCHVVVTSRLKDEYAMQGNELIKTGTRPDSEKNTPYLFDIILRLVKQVDGKEAKYSAAVEKDRSGSLGAVIEDVSFASLAHIAERYQSGQPVFTPSDDEAASEEAQAMEDEEDMPKGKRFTRPMAPKVLRKFITKRIKDTLAAQPKWEEICSEKNAQTLAIEWERSLGHERPTRLQIASFLVNDPIESFTELSEAECDVLFKWITVDVAAAFEESSAIVAMLAKE